MSFARNAISLFFICSVFVFAQQDPETAQPRHVIPGLKYPAADAFVVSLNIMDFKGADNTGRTDVAPLIRTLLKRLEGSSARDGGVGNGGVLFLPEGKYLLESNIIVPKGVTIRGEWKKPEKGEPIVGTILVSDFGRGEETSEKSLIILEPAAGVKDLAFWYPKQDPEEVVPYPPTIGFGAPRYFGNEYCVAQNVTFVNSYSGAVLLYGGGAPNMFGLYGTPLKRGLEIDFIAEVGRVEGLDFSPDYWIGSGLPDSPKNAKSFRNWLRENGTGIVMRRNDWSYVSAANVEGYAVGFHLAETTREGENAKPNGQNYRLRFSDCCVAVFAEAMASVGVMYHDVRIEGCDFGLYVPKNAEGVLQLSRWTVAATRYAMAADVDNFVQILVSRSEFQSGKLELFGGTFVCLDSDINTEKPQVKIGPEARVLMAGNRFSQKVGIVNRSLFECVFDGKPIAGSKPIPEFPYKDPQTIRQKPDRIELYVATEHGVKPNDNEFDCTEPLQKLLDRVASDGGGIVYLPPGKYRILGHLTVPTGVELKGATDIGSVPLGPGSILEAYEGKGNPDAPPLVTMRERSGLRGIVFNYPEQKFDERLEGEGDAAIINPLVYPYAVRVAGKDVYLVNLGFRATFAGIDLFTHRADNVYIEYPSGHFFTYGIRVGGGTENARICNAQFNTIGYSHGDESKFGRWPNARTGKDSQPAYRQNYRDLRFFILEECKNLLLFNNFHFGSKVGTAFGSKNGAPSGLALGHGIDSSIKALYFERLGDGGFDLIGSQIVSLPREVEDGGRAARYIETAPDFSGTVDFFSADFWGSPFTAIEMGGGTVNLHLSRFNNAGRERFFEAAPQTDGTLRLAGSSVNAPSNRLPVNEGGVKRFHAGHSILESGSPETDLFGSFHDNLPISSKMSYKNFLSREGWTVTANRGSNPENMLDDAPETRWGTGKVMEKGDWIVLDMGQTQRFNLIVLDQGRSAGDFPQEYEVFVSDDGENWGEPAVKGLGTQNMTVIRFPTEQNRRFVKISILVPKPSATTWWSVVEIRAAHAKNGSIPPAVKDARPNEK